jgi:predicted ArsR family transcriptional regulator
MSTGITQIIVCIIHKEGYNSGVKFTRQRLMEYLERRQIASAADMSHGLHLTAADIRHHLAVLELEGTVEITGLRPSVGRGRPSSLYQLTRQASSNNLDGLSRALMEETLQSLPEAEQAAFYSRLARRLINKKTSQPRQGSQRFLQAVQQLNQMNYQARWEAHADAPRIIFSHCPYAAILPDHPELCLVDAELLGILLDSPVNLSAHLQPNTHDIPECIFTVQKT